MLIVRSDNSSLQKESAAHAKTARRQRDKDKHFAIFTGGQMHAANDHSFWARIRIEDLKYSSLVVFSSYSDCAASRAKDHSEVPRRQS